MRHRAPEVEVDPFDRSAEEHSGAQRSYLQGGTRRVVDSLSIPLRAVVLRARERSAFVRVSRKRVRKCAAGSYFIQQEPNANANATQVEAECLGDHS